MITTEVLVQGAVIWLLAVADITIFISAVHHQRLSWRIPSGLLAVLETEGLCLMQPV